MLTAPLTLMIPFWTTPVAFLLRPSGHKAPTERRDPPLGGRQGWGRGHSGASASGASPGTKEPAGRRPREPISARQPLATAVPDLQLPSPSISPPPPHPGPPAHLSVSSLPPYWPARVHFRAPAIWYRSGPGVREQVAAAGQLGRRLGRRRPSPAAFVASPCPAARPPRARALPLGLCAASGAAAAVAARGAALGAGGGRAAGRLGAAGPRANMAEVGIDQSKLPGVKEGRGRAWSARGAPPLRQPRSSRGRGGVLRPRGPAPTGAGLPWPGRRRNGGCIVGPWASPLGCKPQVFPV